MDYITVTAKTLDDAITDALVELGVTSDKLDYEVIEKGSAGFLGIGVKQAVIRARRKEEIKEEPETVEKESQAEKKPERKPERKNGNRNNRRREKRNDRKPEKKYEQKTIEKEEEPKKEEPAREIKEVKLAPVEDKTLETSKQFIEDVLRAMGMEEVTVSASVDEEGALLITMDGPNMGILIGKRGQTLDALQYLANRVANKMQEGYVRVKLDTEDYRRRRKQTLENLARNVAAKVRRTRRAVSLEPMNPYERRIIHSALQADPAVSTHSEGEEPYRRIVVTLNRR